MQKLNRLDPIIRHQFLISDLDAGTQNAQRFFCCKFNKLNVTVKKKHQANKTSIMNWTGRDHPRELNSDLQTACAYMQFCVPFR